jgi:DNA (cytosine-5)-methyltransferase 1
MSQGKSRTILAADLFCGAGGTSQGMLMAANRIHADLELLAINHWQVAIDTHSLNHPGAQNLCTGVDVVDPLKLVPGGRLNVLWASPECTHHSVARGGKPMNDQSRASAWHILRWAQVLYIDNLLIENVPEFQSWGPLGVNGRPLKSKRGELFQQFVASLQALGYRVEWRVLNCADYGAPTTRKRFFLIARRGNKKIAWPAATHVRPDKSGMVPMWSESRKNWRTAREIIDWTQPGKSIFGRKKPLADKTLRRIEAGLRKFAGIDVNIRKCVAEDLRPFLIVLRGTGTAASVDAPLQTVTANGNHFGLVEPFLVPIDHAGSGASGARSVQMPVATIVTKQNQALVEPFIVSINHGDGNSPRNAQSVDEPLGTVTGKQGYASIEPFLISYYGTKNMSAVTDPVPTVTTKDRFAVVEVKQERYMLDIRLRMLNPRELARAQGFPDHYQFTGNRDDVVKQIGNAVPPPVAEALFAAVLA